MRLTKKSLPSYKKIDVPHRSVHEYVLKNMKYIEENNTMKNKEAIIDNFTKMENSSSELFTILDDILRES